MKYMWKRPFYDDENGNYIYIMDAKSSNNKNKFLMMLKNENLTLYNNNDESFLYLLFDIT